MFIGFLSRLFTVLVLLVQTLQGEELKYVITVFAGTGKAGYSGDGGAANQAQLNNPFGVVRETRWCTLHLRHRKPCRAQSG